MRQTAKADARRRNEQEKMNRPLPDKRITVQSLPPNKRNVNGWQGNFTEILDKAKIP